MPNPSAITTAQLGDLVQTTLRELGDLKFTEIATDLQVHTAMKNLLRKKRVDIQAGTAIQFDVMVNQTGAAANVGFGATDNVNIVDTMTQGVFDWRNTSTNYAIVGQEIAMNRSPRRIVDLIRTRRIQSMISLAEIMESNFWGSPPSVNDSLTPWGAPTWFQKSATAGFTGGNPSGYTSIALDCTRYPRWQNYAAPYTAVSADDLVRAWRKAATFTNFEPAVDNIPTFETGEANGYYTNYGVIGPLEELLAAQNDNLGSDVASQDGKVMFRRIPVTWVPRLEADTTNPVYAVPWTVFGTFILGGWWMKETSVPIVPGQHTVAANFVDCTYNFGCRNRRRGFVLSTGTTYPN